MTLASYLKDIFGYSKVEGVDPITAEAILANISPDEPASEQKLEIEFRDLYLKHHGLRAKMTSEQFSETPLYKKACKANNYGRVA